MMVMEAIHSTALSCRCGTCKACRASAGDLIALAEVFAAVTEADERREQEQRDAR